MLRTNLLKREEELIISELMTDYPDIYEKILEKIVISIPKEVIALATAVQLIEKGKFIPAIKEVRNILEYTLKDAKEFCDEIVESNEGKKYNGHRKIKPYYINKLAQYKTIYPEYFI